MNQLFQLRFFILLMMCSNCFEAMAQTDSSHTGLKDSVNTKIYKSKQLVKGFYLNKDEFLNNRPSMVRNFSVVEKTTSDKQKAAGIMQVGYLLADSAATVPDKIWGFCDGKDVYVYHRWTLKKNTFWKLDAVGPHAYFIAPLSKKRELDAAAHAAGAFAGAHKAADAISLVDDVLTLLAGSSLEIFILDKKGYFNNVYSEDMVDLFEEEPDIQYQFKHALGPDITEPNQNRCAITRKYLREFNERLIEREAYTTP